ncbi:MAG: hypothetical protein ACRD3J_31140 [Thermoanaerobaculia bacterium]
MNKTIRRLKEQIEQRGGWVHIDESLPDKITEMFLLEILRCPECMEKSCAAENERRAEH